MEILTDQDIPDSEWLIRGLFYMPDKSNTWLKSFSAPNVKYIGSEAFDNCINLTLINFPVATAIRNAAFYECESLTSVTFPNVTSIGDYAFVRCGSIVSYDFPSLTHLTSSFSTGYIGSRTLRTVSMGTSFTSPTTIFSEEPMFHSDGGVGAISRYLEEYTDLILGENVLPAPDTINNTWKEYTWKSITIQKVSIDEIIKNRTVNIFPNPTVANFTVSFELEKSCNLQILLCDILGKELLQFYDGFASAGNFTRTFSTENLPKGIYFLKIFLNGNSTVEKIIVE